LALGIKLSRYAVELKLISGRNRRDFACPSELPAG
jgi:hypothetical protein